MTSKSNLRVFRIQGFSWFFIDVSLTNPRFVLNGPSCLSLWAIELIAFPNFTAVVVALGEYALSPLASTL